MWIERITSKRNAFFREYNDIFRAFEYCRNYSGWYDDLVRAQVAKASNDIFGSDVPEGVAVFSFGAPARKEMMGSSDADVAVYRAGESIKELEFRTRLVDYLQGFGFTKVDTPVWGTLNDIRRYMRTSVTESNQVMEAQFICGDAGFGEQVEALRADLYDPWSIARNLVFQFYYFRQYFQKKASDDHLNLKYCDGGTRDFLFPMWYAQLRKGIADDLQTSAMERGLRTLGEEGLMTGEEIAEVVRSASAVAFIRDELMNVSRGDKDGLLSTPKAIEVFGRRPELYRDARDIGEIVSAGRVKVMCAKAKVWEGLCSYFSEVRSGEWNKVFRKVVAGSADVLPEGLEDDEIINTVKIWNIDGSNAGESLDYIERISWSDSWTVLASLLSSPYVPGHMIDSVIRRKGLSQGYQYLLEIAARNPNLREDTLEFIVADDTTEERFKQPALKRVEGRNYVKDNLL